MGNQPEHKVEILIPAYNAVATLPDALRSIELQTLPVDTVTVVDDASTDDTPEIAKSFPKVRYIRNDRNRGCCGNWNRCLELRTAPFFAILHADDILLPDWHARVQAALATSKSGAACVYLAMARFNSSRDILDSNCFAKAPSYFEPGELLELLWSRKWFGLSASAAMVYPFPIVDRFGFFPADIYPRMADVPYHWRILLKSPIIYEPRISLLVRAGASGQVSLGCGQEHATDALKTFLEIMPDLARTLRRDEHEIMADYLFPYWIMAFFNRTGLGKYHLPDQVATAAKRAMARIGASGIATRLAAQLVENLKRKNSALRNKNEIRRILDKISGIPGIAGKTENR